MNTFYRRGYTVNKRPAQLLGGTKNAVRDGIDLFGLPVDQASLIKRRKEMTESLQEDGIGEGQNLKSRCESKLEKDLHRLVARSYLVNALHLLEWFDSLLELLQLFVILFIQYRTEELGMVLARERFNGCSAELKA